MKKEIKLTAAEEKAIASLRRLAKTWPKSLWLFAGDGTLYIMGRKFPISNDNCCTNQDNIIETISGILADGGGW